MRHLPLELVGTKVLGYLSLKDIVILERACGSKKSHKLFISMIPYCLDVMLPRSKHEDCSALEWFNKKQCRISSLSISLPGCDIPGLQAKNLKIDNINLYIDYNTTIECYQEFIELHVCDRVNSISFEGYHNREVVEQLSICSRSVKQLTIRRFANCMDWLTADILSRWKLTEINLADCESEIVIFIVQICTELTSIKLDSMCIDDFTITTITQHCPKLKLLMLRQHSMTYNSLLSLSEQSLHLEELYITSSIPYIPTADIARRCSHALSCISYIDTSQLYYKNSDATILIPYMTGLTSVSLQYHSHSYIPLLTQYCSKLTKIEIIGHNHCVPDVLSLCCANPLLQDLNYRSDGFTDTVLIELIHACPHLHTLYLPYETDITDIGILALSKHCPHMQALSIRKCQKISEAAVLQLLQRCRRLKCLYVSMLSLSVEAAAEIKKTRNITFD